MKPLDDHPIDKIQLDHERCSFRKGSQDIVNDLPPPPPQLLDQDDDDIDAPCPIAIPSYYPHRPVVSYPRNVAPDEGKNLILPFLLHRSVVGHPASYLSSQAPLRDV